jgi:hypothetical protein
MSEIRVKSTGTIKLFESDNTSSVTIASPASLGGDRTITIPDADVDLTKVNAMPIANLDIDGGTDIGAAIVDADLFIVDDGAGGTNRKTAASRLKTYVGGVTLSGSTNNQVTTVTGANALVGETNLTYDGSTLTATNSNIFINGTTDAARTLKFDADRNAQDEELGIIGFYWGGKANPVAQIRALAGNDTGNEDNGKIEFQTTNEAANGLTTRMHIDQTGQVKINGGTGRASTVQIVDGTGTGYEALSTKASSTGNATQIAFRNPNGTVGYINTNGTATSYGTSSDYRLKENVSYEFDATTRLKQLKPARFNFIADADKTVDGFIAHEVSSIVPEAISGEKDALEKYRNADETPEGKSVGDNKLDENGDTMIDAQSIDQSKLVPLLVKTIQELEARITTLENA